MIEDGRSSLIVIVYPMPYLKAADVKHLSTDDMGQRLVYGERYIECDNSAFILRQSEEDIIATITIEQNAAGIDMEDRIV